jgi:hypothetical protein
MTAWKVQEHLRSLSSLEAAAELASRYCKIGPGKYAEGDVFLGLRAAVMHHLTRTYNALTLDDIRVLLRSTVHEDRSLALLILARRVSGGVAVTRKQVYKLYMAHTRFVNN